MDSDDEQLLRGRIYGADHGHPGPKLREPVGGPPDGLLLDITGWRPEQIDEGVSLLTKLGQFGPAAGMRPVCRAHRKAAICTRRRPAARLSSYSVRRAR